MTYQELDRLIAEWSADVLEVITQLPSDFELASEERVILTSGSMKRAPASQGEIASIEDKLNLSLPPTYKQFLRYSDGLWMASLDGKPGEVLPVADIGLFASLYPKEFGVFAKVKAEVADREYDRYGDSQDPVHYRTIYGPKLVAVSTMHGSGAYFLNPEVRFSFGEYEAWSFSFHGGADRYRSFDDLLRSERVRTVRGYRELLL